MGGINVSSFLARLRFEAKVFRFAIASKAYGEGMVGRGFFSRTWRFCRFIFLTVKLPFCETKPISVCVLSAFRCPEVEKVVFRIYT